MKFSFIIPVFNEADSLRELCDQIKNVCSKSLKEQSYEIIFINDGSTDNSFDILKDLSSKDSKVKIVSFRKNLGKAAALSIAFKKAAGEIVITLDGDLQDGPENIPVLVDKLNQGYDLVIGWKKERKDPIDKTLPSRIFNFFVRHSSKLPLHDFNSGLKVMKKQVSKEIQLYGELHRFIPVLALQRGFKVGEVPVTHHPRKYGKTKYSVSQRFRGVFDFLTITFLSKYAKRPLHFFGQIGGICSLLGIAMLIYLSVLHFQGVSIYRRPLLVLSVLLILAGLQLLSTGLIAELIVDSNNSSLNLPIDYES